MLCMFLDQMIFSREQLPPKLSPVPSLQNVAARETWSGSRLDAMHNSGLGSARSIEGSVLHHACNNGNGLHLIAGKRCCFVNDDFSREQLDHR